MFAPKWSAKVEYLHYDLGTGSFTCMPSSGFFAVPVYQTVLSSVHFYGDLGRAVASYHF
jgi:outer membrane immunogenic protein